MTRSVTLGFVGVLASAAAAIAAGGLFQLFDNDAPPAESAATPSATSTPPVTLRFDVADPAAEGGGSPDLGAVQALVRDLAGIVLGEDSMVYLATSLASAIREAERSYPQAQALPAPVKERLRGMYPAAVLDEARWTVGRLEINLPAAINQAMAFLGHDDNAVTVGHTIVFSRLPEIGGDMSDDSLAWWAHEVRHVEQYRELGIDGFAAAYVRDPDALERDARHAGARAVAVAGSARAGRERGPAAPSR